MNQPERPEKGASASEIEAYLRELEGYHTSQAAEKLRENRESEDDE